MKKKILIVMVLFFGLLLTGCNKKETRNTIIEKNTIKVELDLNSESGYSWSYIVNNQDIVSISKTYVGDCSNNVDNCDGKDIYEGDIVRVSSPSGSSYYAKIEFDHGCYWVSNPDIQIPDTINNFNMDFVVVDGTIFDNPELLEVEK